ncbi:uncharacterized protein F4807DRAFT_471115 [Annulohypoxylon truncatum]|uniref:uncharacterized protein n=1 Tax=Annulohypoxylon truncatum TaxID=327061 RepID=UPI0020072512|nr:uncharacterized protein F4807DRAFT_471115 [Annulohypoxylon truncatum]KAI1205440.1 hypothetical protein F4807DRAFT_471115 [Annulohypoxylon truncatum]
MEKRSNIRRYAQTVRDYYDDGEREGRVTIYVEPRQIYDATTALVDARRDKVLFIQLPFNSPRLLNLSHELLHSIRDVSHVPCTWFFGSNRAFQGRYPTPQGKMLSLLSSMIVQLIKLLPKRFNDPDMALSQQVFNSLHLPQPDHMGMAISIPVAINIIKALLKVIPHGILFFFEGCDDLAQAYERPLDEICGHFAYLLRCLARHESGRPRKILWIQSGASASFETTISGAVRAENYNRVEYPRDWNDGRRRGTRSILTTRPSYEQRER